MEIITNLQDNIFISIFIPGFLFGITRSNDNLFFYKTNLYLLRTVKEVL